MEKINKISDMVSDSYQTCTMCSKSSPKEEWAGDKCPACGQVLILADEAEYCPNCNAMNRKRDIVDGRCPKCR